ncbi:MAG: hypothetical protein ACRD0D_01030, partial [Acidimicrobiales bacterium]
MARRPGPAGRAPGPPPPPRPGFLSRAAADLGQTVAAVPRGIVSLVTGLPREAARFTRRGGNIGLLVAAAQGREGLARFARSPSADQADLLAAWQEQFPIFTGAAESALATGRRIASPRLALRQYSARPVSTLVEDVSNISSLVAPAGRAAGAVAAGPRAGTAVGRAARGVQLAADAPYAPFRAGRAAAHGAARAAYEAAASSQGPAGGALRLLRIDPESREVRRLLAEGSEAQAMAVGEAITRGERLERRLGDIDEQRAAQMVGEGEAPALAAVRSALGEERFAAWAAQRYGPGDVPAALLAARVASGEAADVAGRIEEFLAYGAPGREARSAAYLAARPGRAEQMGFEPLRRPVEEAAERAGRLLPRAERLAGTLRARARRESAALEDLRASWAPAAAARQEALRGAGRASAAERAVATRAGRAAEALRAA